jgi:four helix bundle protein
MGGNYQFTFEKLRVWQEARVWVREIFGFVKGFPVEEKYGLSNQLTRSAVSVAANLAEGASRTSAKDQAHFSQLAYSSLMEAACLLLMAGDQGWVGADRIALERQKIESLSNQINALRKTQLTRSR